MEDKINLLIKAVSINAKLFWPGLFAKVLANFNIKSFIWNAGVDGPVPSAGTTPAGGLDPSNAVALAEEKKVKAKNCNKKYVNKLILKNLPATGIK